MRGIRVACAIAIMMMVAIPATLNAQKAAPPINVFLDCQASDCDTSHFRTELTFVNWVRDRTDADVHLLITSQTTGGGGRQYALSFIGLRRFQKDSVQTGFTTDQNATSAERRDALENRIAQGLLHYAVATEGMDRVLVKMRGESDDDESSHALAAGQHDPWNHWVFAAGVDGSTDGESQQSSKELSLEMSADRITELWKIELSVDGSYRENRFELDEGTLRSIRRNYSADIQVTRALGRLWSGGLIAEGGTSTFRNQDLYLRFAPVLEYSFLPYSEFSRRRITLQYSAGVNRYNYTEITIYDKLHETLYDEKLELATRFQQPWGSAGASLTGSHFFHDIHRYEISGDASMNVRLLKGLSMELGGEYSRVHNQVYIRKGDASDEDVLLERLALATGYQYSASVGLRYTFGSIYNNIVNRRID